MAADTRWPSGVIALPSISDDLVALGATVAHPRRTRNGFLCEVEQSGVFLLYQRRGTPRVFALTARVSRVFCRDTIGIIRQSGL